MANIRKRNGKWQAQVRRDGYPLFSKTIVHRRDAETLTRQSEAGLDKAALPADPKRIRTLTLGALVERYAVEVTPQKLSVYAEMSRIRILRADAIYKISLAQLSPIDIAEFLACRFAATVEGALSALVGNRSSVRINLHRAECVNVLRPSPLRRRIGDAV
jgi:hypothetical protein